MTERVVSPERKSQKLSDMISRIVPASTLPTEQSDESQQAVVATRRGDIGIIINGGDIFFRGDNGIICGG